MMADAFGAAVGIDDVILVAHGNRVVRALGLANVALMHSSVMVRAMMGGGVWLGLAHCSAGPRAPRHAHAGDGRINAKGAAGAPFRR